MATHAHTLRHTHTGGERHTQLLRSRDAAQRVHPVTCNHSGPLGASSLAPISKSGSIFGKETVLEKGFQKGGHFQDEKFDALDYSKKKKIEKFIALVD